MPFGRVLSWAVVISSPGTPVYPQPYPTYGGPSYHTPRLPMSRWHKTRLWLLGSCVVLVLLVIAFPLVGAYVVRSMVLPRLEDRYDCLIQVGDVSVRPTRVVLRRIHVKNGRHPAAPELAVVPRVEVRFTFLSLLLFRVHLTEVLVEEMDCTGKKAKLFIDYLSGNGPLKGPYKFR